MKIGILIPVFNQAEYIGEAIESALAQTYRPHEIIVVDDGSTDATQAVCERYRAHIKYIKQENAGPSGARNTGLRHLSSEAVVFLDGDDVLCPTWLGRAANAFQKAVADGKKVGGIYSDYVVFDDAGTYERKVSIKNVTLAGLLRDSLLIPSGCFVTKACLDDVGSFNRELPTCEDWDYWLRAALHDYSFIRVATYGFKHREHDASLSKHEIPALQGRLKFLQLWLDNDELKEAQKAVVRQEMARTFLRLRRASYFRGHTSEPYVREALDRYPAMIADPWLFVYGAVYAAPFFRAHITDQQVLNSLEVLHQDITSYLGAGGRLNGRIRRRLAAGSVLGRAANETFSRRYMRAIRAVLSAIATDPTLVPEALRRLESYGAEIVRAKWNL